MMPIKVNEKFTCPKCSYSTFVTTISDTLDPVKARLLKGLCPKCGEKMNKNMLVGALSKLFDKISRI